MTRNQRARRRLRTEQRQARRRQQQTENKLAKAQQIRKIKYILANHNDGPWAHNEFSWSVLQKVPKLAENESAMSAINAMKPLSRFRCVDQWQPQGKSWKAILQSLAEHLFAVWPMPKILWSVFWEETGSCLRKAVVKIAGGTSLYGLVKKGEFPVSLTKKQCHQLLSMPARYSLLQGIRMVQVASAGGTPVLFEQWWATPMVKTIQSPEAETFWQQVLSWFARQKALTGKQVFELVQYFRQRRTRDGQFNVKGRTLENVLADMEIWKKERALLQHAMGFNLPASGFIDLQWQELKPNNKVEQRWEVKELLSRTALFEEGKAMDHCVYSYKGKIAKGQCSIWTVHCDGQKRVTIELLNHRRQIVQVKGRGNREANTQELVAVKRWAFTNGLALCLASY